MPDSIERCLEAALTDSCGFGQILMRRTDSGGFVLLHRDDKDRDDLPVFRNSDDAAEIARYDDAGKYRPLKAAPNLRHGWRLEIANLTGLRRALDYFYPGRLAMFVAWKENRLATTPLRQTLNRQSGMYRVAAKISDDQINQLLGDFCRSNGGCLRTILWRRGAHGTVPSARLPPEKFEPVYDQAVLADRPRSAPKAFGAATTVIPLLCQEACNLLIAECRRVVKNKSGL